MAFLPNTQDQNQQQNQQQGQVPTVPQIPTLQGTSGPTASQSSGASGVTNTASPAAAPSTPWQNISAYLGANAGQAGQVADTIAGNLGSQYNAANQGIQQAQQNVGQQIQSARVPYDQQAAQQAAQSPSQFASDPNNVAAFQKMFNANYQGPQSFSGSQGYSDLQAQVQKAQQQAGLVNQGTPGLMTLLQQAESQDGRNPTQGITALDSLLMQEDPANFGKLSAAAAPFAGLSSYLSSTQQGLDASAQNAAKEAAATQSQIQGQFTGPGGVIPSFQGRLNQQMQDAGAKAKAFNQTSTDLAAFGNNPIPGSLTPDEMSAVGYNPAFTNLLKEYTGVQTALPGFAGNLPNPNFSNAVILPDQPAAMPTLQNVASSQDYADAAALAQLTGSAMPLDASTASQAGSFALPKAGAQFSNSQAAQDLMNYLNSTGEQNAVNLAAPNAGDTPYATAYNDLLNFLGQPQPSPITTVGPTLGGGLPGTPTAPPITNGGGRAFR